jgi:iron complex outermembrane receptor protein
MLPTSAVGQGIPGITAGTTTVSVLLGKIPSVRGFPAPAWSRNPRTGIDYPGDDRKLESLYLRTDLDLGPAEMVALSYYGNSDVTQFHDTFPNGDATVTNAIQETHLVAANRLLSQDVRFQSTDTEGPLNWSVGGLVWWETTRYDNRSNACFSTIGGCAPILAGLGVSRPYFLPVGANVYYRDTHHYSLYGRLDYQVMDAFTLSAEIRHTWEDEKIASSVTSPAGNIIGCPGGLRLQAGPTLTCLTPGPQVQTPSVATFLGGQTLASTKTKSEFYTPRFTAEYQIDGDRMVYVSAAKGQKPGGVLSLLSPILVAGVPNFDLTKFKEEILWVYEVGIKAEWLDGRARTNADIYWQDFSNKQETGTRIGADGLPVTGPGNAEKARVKGFEFDGTLIVSDDLTTSLGYSYIDSKYVRFNIVQSTATNIALAGNCLVTRPAVGNPFCNVSYAGRHLALAPKHSGTINVDWHRPFTDDIQLFTEVDGRYMSKRYTSPDNQVTYSSFTTVDARIGFRADNWQVTGYVNNLLQNKEITAAGTVAPNFQLSLILPSFPGTISSAIANLPDKRQFGVRMSYTY